MRGLLKLSRVKNLVFLRLETGRRSSPLNALFLVCHDAQRLQLATKSGLVIIDSEEGEGVAMTKKIN